MWTEERHDGDWTCHAYGPKGLTALQFAISPDGTVVESSATPIVPHHDLTGLFAEAVMRSVFHRRGIVSFHGAALAKNGAAIMVLGDKGAGKSTLAGALIAQGWHLLTDDLIRVERTATGWRVPSGFTQLKLNEDSAAALGYEPSSLARRWQSPLCPPGLGFNKVVVAARGVPPSDAPLAAIYVLGQRRAAGAGPELRTLAPGMRLAALTAHITENPRSPGERPSRRDIAFAGALLGDVPLQLLELPGSIKALEAVGHTLSASFRQRREA